MDVVLGRMPDFVDEVVVVDNNSTDGTGEVARSLGAKVVRETRRGYGAAYKAGLAAAGGDVIATLDGDDTYPPEAISGLVDALEDTPADFISAARFPLADASAMPLTNQFGNWVLTTTHWILFGRALRDSQSGMWVFRRSILPSLHLTSDGMPFSEEIKIEAMMRPGIRFLERHIEYRQRIGTVKLQRWREGAENLLFLLRKRFGRNHR